MKILPIASGSTGNCTYIESAGCKLLLDVGVSVKRIQVGLAMVGKSLTDIDAIVISHQHTDHISALPQLAKQFAIPILSSAKNLNALNKVLPAQYPREVLGVGTRLEYRGLTIENHAVPHDCIEPLVFVFEEQGKRYGHFTDLGHVPEALKRVVASLHAMTLESNYDPQLLAQGPYPAFLKKRISGGRGHISNQIAMDLASKHGSKLQTLILGHLSKTNNQPQKVLDQFLPLKKIHAHIKLGIARPDRAMSVVEL